MAAVVYSCGEQNYSAIEKLSNQCRGPMLEVSSHCPVEVPSASRAWNWSDRE